jgi:hypothetical protein
VRNHSALQLELARIALDFEKMKTGNDIGPWGRVANVDEVTGVTPGRPLAINYYPNITYF